MNPRVLGLMAMLGSPFLCLDFLSTDWGAQPQCSLVHAFNGLLFTSGWLCAVLALGQLTASGRLSAFLMRLQVSALVFTALSYVLRVLYPAAMPLIDFLYRFESISYACMLLTGILVLVNGRSLGLLRVMPVLAAIWYPLSLFGFSIIFGGTPQWMLVSAVLGSVLWFGVGYNIWNLARKAVLIPVFAFS